MDECCEGMGDAFNNLSPKGRCGVIGFCCSFITFLIYLAVALEGIEPTDYGIIKHNISQNIDRENIYEGGIHWVGLFNTLIHYPAREMSIEFSNQPTADKPQLDTRTKEGLDLGLHFAFQYKFQKEKLPDLYRYVETDYQRLIERMARNSVLEIAGTYQGKQYWEIRNDIGMAMKRNLVKEMEKIYAEVTGFMLLKIDLPDVYESAIVKTQVTKQEEKTYMTRRAVQLTQQQTRNEVAVSRAEIVAIESQAAMEATISKNTGLGTVAKQNIDYTTQALAEVQKQLQFSPSTKGASLIKYFEYTKLADLSPNTKNILLVGLTESLIDLS